MKMLRTLRSIRLLAIALAFGAAALPGVVLAGEDALSRLEGPVAARVVKVRDGDTVEVEAFVWPQQTVHVAVRLRGIDGPELKARCTAERQAAEAAKARLADLVAGGEVRLRDVSGDKYFGRVLAKVAAGEEPDIAARLLNEGLVAPYRGEKRRDWCAGQASLSQ